MDKFSIIIIVGALAIMFVFMLMRQKRDAKRSQELMNSFKVGDKVLTHIGIYGKIKRIYNTSYGKVCVLEIGTTNKIDIELDMRYIAGIDEKTTIAEEIKNETAQTEVENSVIEEQSVEKKESIEAIEEKKEKNNKKTKNGKKTKKK